MGTTVSEDCTWAAVWNRVHASEDRVEMVALEGSDAIADRKGRAPRSIVMVMVVDYEEWRWVRAEETDTSNRCYRTNCELTWPFEAKFTGLKEGRGFYDEMPWFRVRARKI